MARKSRIDTEKQANGAALKAKGRKTAAKRKIARTSPSSATSAALPAASGYEPSDEEIRVRAYFIAERRMELSLEGDSDQDWLEAKRQLVEEARRSSS